MPEPWLRGPIPGVAPLLMPSAHALAQAAEDLERAVRELTVPELWARPGGAASVGFHLRHIAGSIDRLATYVRGDQLARAQLDALQAEGEPGDPPADASALMDGALAAIDRMMGVLRGTPVHALLEPRAVGRARLPSTVLGLLFHVAEHTQRHVGQTIATAKVVRANAPTATPPGSGTPPRP
jgi:uncharacterized damage-inducible protein DinB